jgi:hypothetical protein
MMFLTATIVVLLHGGVRYRGIGTIRGPWVWALSGLYIAIGIGLLRRYKWARLATIAAAILAVGLLGVALVNGLLQARLIFLFGYLLRLPIDALIVWYLLKPEVRRTFTRPEA